MVYFRAVEITDEGFIVNFWPENKADAQPGSFFISFDGSDVRDIVHTPFRDYPPFINYRSYASHAIITSENLLKNGEADKLIDGWYSCWY